MKIVLAAIHAYPSPQAVPLANGFLKSHLMNDPMLAEKVSVELSEFFCDKPVEAALSTILSKNPDAVGLSIYLWNRKMAVKLVKALRRRKPQIIIFAGGPEPTGDPEGLLRQAPFDFLILGEGELTLAEAISALVNGRDAAGIEGTAYLHSGEVVINKRCRIEDLDSIASPYLSGQLDPAAYGGILWQLARGCGMGCDYCFDSQGMSGVHRFSMERILAELDFFVENRVSQIFVIDSTFNQDKKTAKKILRLIEQRTPNIHFHFEIRSEFIDVEMAHLFAQINCSLQIGLQSAHPQVHRMVSRAFNPGQFSGKIGMLNESGAIFGFDLIYGLPGDTLEGFFASIDFAIGLYPNHLDIFPLAVLPGTALAAKAEGFGLRFLNSPPYTLQSSPGFPSGAMEDAAAMAMACDIFYSRGKAVAWFNSLLAPLDISPSAFLQKFLEWLKSEKGDDISEIALSDEDIRQTQRDFITYLYKNKKIHRYLPAALDQVDYNWLYAAALLAVPPEIPGEDELDSLDLLDTPLVLAPSAGLARFNYSIHDILNAGEIELESFFKQFRPRGSYAAIYPFSSEVMTESLTESHYKLLSRLDGMTLPRHISKTLNIPMDEARDLLRFCAAEGIVISR